MIISITRRIRNLLFVISALMAPVCSRMFLTAVEPGFGGVLDVVDQLQAPCIPAYVKREVMLTGYQLTRPCQPIFLIIVIVIGWYSQLRRGSPPASLSGRSETPTITSTIMMESRMQRGRA